VALVLVGEQDVELRRTIAEELRREGHEVREFQDGLNLLFHIIDTMTSMRARELIGVLVAALNLPVFGALEILAFTRRLGPRVPLILLAPANGGVDMAHAHSLGATAVFASPPDLAALRAAVRDVT
jgi:DNA-binding response OmpR family regulator